MELITGLIDFIIHIDKHLAEIIQVYGTWTYLILFAIIFCETGLVVTPFLPGDSFLFVVGALGAAGAMDFKLSFILLAIAAVGGNTVNYLIGRLIGDKILSMDNSRLIKKEYIERTHVFYEKHGGKAIVLSRFLPILRTFAPFVAGIGNMGFMKFTFFNLIGGISWIISFMALGYFFGNIPLVKDNFTFVILGIVAVSLLPAFVAYLRGLNAKRIKEDA